MVSDKNLVLYEILAVVEIVNIGKSAEPEIYVASSKLDADLKLCIYFNDKITKT